ncbi:MAG: radical SAM protein [Magnetococcales bacterium]|nr:radical SAM protein [Magnetococcales bacterium]
MRKISEKIDAITGIKPEQRTPTPPCPKACKIELTGRCNLKCSFCATSKNLRDKQDMDWDFYCRLLRDFRQSGGQEVGMFYLGESMMLPWLPKAIREAKEVVGFPYVFLTTNGINATAKKVEECMRAGLDSLKFSLNYASAEQFAEIARVKAVLFGTLVDNIKQARRIRDEHGFNCGLYASYISYDGEQGRRMQSLTDELTPYLDEIYALPLYSQADLTGKENKEAGWFVSGGNPGRVGNLRDPVPCWSLFTEARVTWDGRLSMCCFDHDERFNAGNLNEHSFMEVWHSPKFQALRKEHLTGDVRGTACEQCISYSVLS